MRALAAALVALACGAVAALPAATGQPVPSPSPVYGCEPLLTGPDVETRLCWDLGDLSCPLYTQARHKDETQWGHKHCLTP